MELKSGGYLIVDQTEALTTIDVNTGGYVGARNFEDTIFKTNLEAAGAIARQLRLRNLGGIIIADFYQAKWADVDLDGAQWHIPKSKTGAAMGIPLAPIVVEGFRELRRLAARSACVLPAHLRRRAARHGADTHFEQGHAAGSDCMASRDLAAPADQA